MEAAKKLLPLHLIAILLYFIIIKLEIKTKCCTICCTPNPIVLPCGYFSLEDEYLFAQSAGQSADSLNCCQSQAVPTDNTAQEATMVYS